MHPRTSGVGDAGGGGVVLCALTRLGGAGAQVGGVGPAMPAGVADALAGRVRTAQQNFLSVAVVARRRSSHAPAVVPPAPARVDAGAWADGGGSRPGAQAAAGSAARPVVASAVRRCRRYSHSDATLYILYSESPMKYAQGCVRMTLTCRASWSARGMATWLDAPN
jgi:hypothetical protein